MLFDTSSDLGAILTVKHVLVLAMIIIGLNIALGVVPKLRAAAPKPGEAPSTDFFKNQRRLRTLATVNMVLGVLVVACASMLW